MDVGPAGEWLLDNYHVVQEHIGEVRESLPSGYYRELPELAGGPLAGYPRVYELAITLISHSEGRIDLDNVSGFVEAFQKVSALTIGELWAVPAMLRLGLIENVRRMALRTVQRLDELELADEAARRSGRGRRRGEERPRCRAGPVCRRPAAADSDLRLPLPAPAPGGRWRAPGRGAAGAVDRRRGAERGGRHRPRRPSGWR